MVVPKAAGVKTPSSPTKGSTTPTKAPGSPSKVLPGSPPKPVSKAAKVAKGKSPHCPRNVPLIPGVMTLSRSSKFSKKLQFKRKLIKIVAKPAPALTKVKKIGGAKNGGTRNVSVTKPSRFYPAEDESKPKASRKSKPQPPKVRASITPGTVLILLAGRFRGKRVVCVKALSSGLILVTGPFKVNGVPLRRVNQAYVIATSTKLDLSSLKLDLSKVNDSTFKRESKQTKAEMFAQKEKNTISPSRIALQKKVDSQLLPLIKKTPYLKNYLNASFCLTKGQSPHVMKF